MSRTRNCLKPLARSLATACLAACAALGLPVPAQAQAPGPESFAKKPETPLELWDAVDYLVRVGQADQAVPYLNAFLKSKPSDDVLLEIREHYGAGSVLRLGDYPATRAQARPLMEMMASASHRHVSDPDRIRQFVADLTKSREEQQYAVEQLRQAGPPAVPILVQVMRQPNLPLEERAQIVGNMGRLNHTAVPALLCVLDSPDTMLAADAAEALGRIGDQRAVPYLTYYAAPGARSPIGDAARRAIARLTGRPFEAQPRAPARVLTDEAKKYETHAVNFPSDQVELWVWDDGPVPRTVSRSEAESLLGLRFAREALALDPADTDAQVIFVGVALEKAAEQEGPESLPAKDPTGAYSSALAAGPAVLGEVLRRAIASGHSELAIVAAGALGRVTNRDALATDRRPNPLVEALNAPDRRVQFAAARTLVELEPQKPFPGSSRVVPVLARFVANHSAPKAVIIDSNTNRGSQLVAFLKTLEYDPMLAPTGEQGFRLARESADVEVIFLEPSLASGSWRLVDTLSNLRADANTTGIPIFLVVPLGLHDRLRVYTKTFPRVGLLVTPTNAQVLKTEFDQELGRMGVRPLSTVERESLARDAAALLARVASQPGSPFERDLSAARTELGTALHAPATGIDASKALGGVPGVDAQRGLADVLLDPSKADDLRLNAANMLVRSISRFGPLVSAIQEQKLAELLDQTTDPALRTVLASVIGALRPKPASIGRRLQGYNTRSGTSAAEAPAPKDGGKP